MTVKMLDEMKKRIERAIEIGTPRKLMNTLWEFYQEAEEAEREKKVVIPQFVADWIKKQREQEFSINEAYEANYNILKERDVYVWLYHGKEADLHQELFARAWLDDYRVEETKFVVGEYYSFDDLGIYEAFKVLQSKENKIEVKTYNFKKDEFKVFESYTTGNSRAITQSKKATDEEIQQFKVAEMYHKHGRKFGELKAGDIVKDEYGDYIVLRESYNLDEWHNQILEGKLIFYLTAEELQKAHEEIENG